MARHARLGRGDAGEPRRLHRRVAVAAVDPQPLDVVLVAERHRLVADHRHLRHVWRPEDRVHDAEQPQGEEHRPEDAHAREDIRAPREHLSHGRPFFLSSSLVGMAPRSAGRPAFSIRAEGPKNISKSCKSDVLCIKHHE